MPNKGNKIYHDITIAKITGHLITILITVRAQSE